AEYEGHWAYIPPTRPEVPAAVEFPGEAASGGVTNPIDRFLRARIAASALTPSPEADRVTLARRLYLDLTGLPPTPAQIDEFLADSEPEAYERLVERLIDSPEYGERMATWW